MRHRLHPDADIPERGAGLIVRGILLFWALWISLVVLANLVGELKALHVAPALWPLASGNFGFIRKETAIYSIPWWADQVFFVGIILWESLGAALFWRALVHTLRRTRRRLRATYTAHGVLMALFAGFILGDEMVHDFRVEGDHRGILLLLLISLLAVTLLPSE